MSTEELIHIYLFFLTPFHCLLHNLRYSDKYKEWGLLMVDGQDTLLYICEVPQANLNMLIDESVERSHEYGIIVRDPRKVPKGPKIITQPKDRMFDLARREVINYVSVMCLGMYCHLLL